MPESSGFRRAPIVAIDRQGISGSLNAPGAAGGVVDNGGMMAKQIVGIIQGAGGVFTQYAQNEADRARAEERLLYKQEQATYKSERQQEKLDRLRESEQNALRGTGHQMGSEALPGLLNAIDTKQVIVGENPKEQFDGIVSVMTDGMDPSQAEGFRQRVMPQLLAAAYQQQNKTIAEAKSATYQDFVSSMQSSGDPGGVVAAAIGSGMFDEKTMDAASIQYAKNAASIGDEEGISKAKAALSDQNLYATELVEVDNLYKRWQSSSEGSVVDSFHNDLATVTLNGATYAQQLDFIEQQRGTVPERYIVQAVSSVQSAQRQAERESFAQLVKVEKSNFESEVAYKTAQKIVSGDSYNIEESTRTFSDGSDKTISINQSKEAGIKLLFDQIDKNSASPEQAFISKIDISAKSGYQIPQLVALLKTGPVSMSDKDVQDKNVPQQTVQAFRVYKMLHSKYPDYLNSLEIGNEKAVNMMEAARIFQGTGNASDDANAMIQGSNAINSPRPIHASDAQKVEDKFNQMTGVSGGSYVSRNYINQYMTLMLKVGVGVDEAAQKAADYAAKSGTIINESFVLTNDIELSPETRSSYEMISNLVSKNFADKYGTSIEDYHLEKGPFGYQLYHTTGLPAPGSPYYSADQLNKMAVDENTRKNAEENQRAIDAAKKRTIDMKKFVEMSQRNKI
jgi:hypothetical protein